MKVGFIITPNQKGQVVIPKKVREALNIKPNTPLNILIKGQGIYMYPVKGVLTPLEAESSYLELLKVTQGAWKKENWKGLRKKRRKIEISASLKRKKRW
jgi:AbrB family looped-hinge helix DNA binding protein